MKVKYKATTNQNLEKSLQANPTEKLVFSGKKEKNVLRWKLGNARRNTEAKKEKIRRSF